MRTFRLLTRRSRDRSRALVAEGVQFTDGHIVVRWRSPRPVTIALDSLDDLLFCCGNATDVEWLDPPADPAQPTFNDEYGERPAPKSMSLSEAAASLGRVLERPDDPDTDTPAPGQPPGGHP